MGFSEEEKNKALESFKGKFALELLNSLKNDLPAEHQEWINGQSGNTGVSQDDPKVLEIQQAIKEMYPEDQLYEKSKEVFRHVLKDYIQFMSSDLEPDSVSKLDDLLTRI